MVPKTVSDMRKDEKPGEKGPAGPLLKALLTDREYLLGWHFVFAHITHCLGEYRAL